MAVKAEVEVLNKLGLHARPATKLVKIASTSQSIVHLTKSNQRINAKSILGVMLLQAEQGSKLIIEVEGEDEKEVLEALVSLVRNKFDEE